MRMSRSTTLLHLLLGLRTSTTAPVTALSHSSLLHKSPSTPLLSSAQCHATNLYHLYQSANLTKTYSTSSSTSTQASTMSSTNNQDPQPQPDPQQQPEASQTESKPLLALPDAGSATHQLDVNGDGVKLDHLGPLIVNQDGTLSRIGNWAQMTELEKKNTLRVLGKRNKERMARLKAEQAEGAETKE
ncbi:hypothetical protein BJY04DRAFT_89615 [Aspergillus karnatakaensis]|uniref:uncharacterized protein n=1 Tax=Aspergillus karnatakaensis TaxID=1810916 RepID=UPI003CCCC024